MPQVAQQDYIVIKNEYRNREKVNCHCLAKLRQCLENNTLFDVLFQLYPFVPGDTYFPAVTRIVSHEDNTIRYHKAGGTLDSIMLSYSVTTYEFYAAIQDAYVNKEGSFPNAIPDLVMGEGDALYWSYNDDYWTITNNGRKIVLSTDDDDIVVGYSLGDEDSGENTLDIPDDVMPYLIGMMIS